MADQEMRGRSFLFTIAVAGEGSEHKLISLSGGPRQIVEEDTHTESTRMDNIDLAGHFNTENLSITEAPFMGCISEPVGNFLFDMAIEGKEIARIRRVSGLGVSWEIMTNREGDKLGTQKLWGKRSYGEVTLEATKDWQDPNQLYQFAKKIGEFTGPGAQFVQVDGKCDYVTDVIITVRKNDMEEVAKWTLHRAWPHQFSLGDLSADSTDIQLESIIWRLAPLPGMQGVTEDLHTYFENEQLVSGAWYEFIENAFKCPQKKDLILHKYHPCQTPGEDAPVGSYKLFNAWPSEVTYGDLNAMDNDRLTRDITIAYEGFAIQ